MEIQAAVVYSLIFSLAFLLVLFFILAERRFLSQKIQKRNSKIQQKIENNLLDILSSRPRCKNLISLKPYVRYPEIFTRAMIDLQAAMKGNIRERMKQVFDDLLKERIQRDLCSRKKLKRLRAVRPFVIFSGPSDFELIAKLLRDDHLIKLAALSALVQNPQPFVLDMIYQSLLEDEDFNSRFYFDIFVALGNKIEPCVKELLNEPLSKEKLSLLIEITGTIPLPSLYSELLSLSADENKEIRIRTARALGNISIPIEDIVETLIKMSSDQAWEVQAQAYKSLGKLRSLEALDTLSRGLYSPNWHCRLNAGWALAKLGKAGLKQLNKVSKQQEDKYAADMANMVLNTMIINRS